MLQFKFNKGFLLVLTMCIQVKASAQGTVYLNFENDALGTSYSFIRPVHSAPFPPVATVKSGGFEGNQSLFATTEFTLSSPDNLPIKNFSLYYYIPKPGPAGDTLKFGIMGGIENPATAIDIPGDQSKRGEWQYIEGTFPSPVNKLLFYAAGGSERGETYYSSFAVDALTLVTVPEPGTISLGLIGLFGLLVFKRKKRN